MRNWLSIWPQCRQRIRLNVFFTKFWIRNGSRISAFDRNEHRYIWKVGLFLLARTLLTWNWRVSLFLACNQYLRRSLYQDLRHLSSSDIISRFPTHERQSSNYDTELDELPTPVTTPRPAPGGFVPEASRNTSSRNWHSSLSIWTFSLCFSESCTLFLLILTQALGLFSERSVVSPWTIPRCY